MEVRRTMVPSHKWASRAFLGVLAVYPVLASWLATRQGIGDRLRASSACEVKSSRTGR